MEININVVAFKHMCIKQESKKEHVLCVSECILLDWM